MSPSTFFVAAAAALVVAASAQVIETGPGSACRQPYYYTIPGTMSGRNMCLDPIKFEGYVSDIACIGMEGSKSVDKQVSVLAKPEEHTKSCLMMEACINGLVLLEAPATAGSDYTIKYHLAGSLRSESIAISRQGTQDLRAVAAAQIKASNKTAGIKVQIEGCLTGLSMDMDRMGPCEPPYPCARGPRVPLGRAPILDRCPSGATTTANPDRCGPSGCVGVTAGAATTTAAAGAATALVALAATVAL